jgi:hypothetical protein
LIVKSRCAAATYKAVRGGKLDEALETIRTIAQCSGTFTFTVSSIAMDGNVKTLKGFSKMLAQLGVQTYIVQSLWGFRSEGGIDGDFHRNPDAASEVLNLKRTADENGIALAFQMPEWINAELNQDSVRWQRAIPAHSRTERSADLIGEISG